MADPHTLASLRIRFQALATLDCRPFHVALQPYRRLVRLDPRALGGRLP